MTPDEVHKVAFAKPPIGQRGYDEEDVDAFLDLVEATLRGESRLGLDQLRHTTFRRPPFGKRGYRREEVDSFIQRVISEWPAE
jgi:DivIVA domain-containing protein